MDAFTLSALLIACAPNVEATTARALVQVESTANPYAIGVVGGSLVRQPANRAEAIATAKALRAEGWNFSAGLGQINVRNFEQLGLDAESVFDPCPNLQAMQAVLTECFDRAKARVATTNAALRDAFSCYYSGSFATGHRDGYVLKVVRASRAPMQEPAVTLQASKEQP